MHHIYLITNQRESSASEASTESDDASFSSSRDILPIMATDRKDRTKNGWFLANKKGSSQWCPGTTPEDAEDNFIAKDRAYALILRADLERRRGAAGLFDAMNNHWVDWNVSGGIHSSADDEPHFNILIKVRRPNKEGVKVKKHNGQWHCYVHKDYTKNWSVTSCTHD